jgi:hypothetical protein
MTDSYPSWGWRIDMAARCERYRLKDILIRLQNAKANERGVHFNAQEVLTLLGIQGIQDEITTHKRNQKERPPICYTPLTGPAPGVALLNRCDLIAEGRTSFECCRRCWCLRDSAWATL